MLVYTHEDLSQVLLCLLLLQHHSTVVDKGGDEIRITAVDLTGFQQHKRVAPEHWGHGSDVAIH